MINKVFDLKSYLCLLYYSEFNKIASDQEDSILNKYRLSFLDTNYNLYFLNSNLFGKLFSQELISTQAVFVILLHILQKIQLQHIIRIQINLDNSKEPIIIKEQIFSFIIKIIKMPMTPI
jgi:hypothetical protein